MAKLLLGRKSNISKLLVTVSPLVNLNKRCMMWFKRTPFTLWFSVITSSAGVTLFCIHLYNLLDNSFLKTRAPFGIVLLVYRAPVHVLCLLVVTATLWGWEKLHCDPHHTKETGAQGGSSCKCKNRALPRNRDSLTHCLSSVDQAVLDSCSIKHKYHST